MANPIKLSLEVELCLQVLKSYYRVYTGITSLQLHSSVLSRTDIAQVLLDFGDVLVKARGFILLEV